MIRISSMAIKLIAEEENAFTIAFRDCSFTKQEKLLVNTNVRFAGEAYINEK